MSPTLQALGIDQLSVAERILLVEEIWDGIAKQEEELSLTEAQKFDLERRVAAYEADPKAGASWKKVDFRQVVANLEPKFADLMAMAPVCYSTLPRQMPKRGIYLFSEGDQHRYVGRTNRIRQRLAGHCRPSSNHFSATFAFRLAREKSGFLKATYASKGSRPSLVNDPVFGPAFFQAKADIAKMDLRFIEETDPIRQALLEIYVAISLKTPNNDFDNH